MPTVHSVGRAPFYFPFENSQSPGAIRSRSCFLATSARSFLRSFSSCPFTISRRTARLPSPTASAMSPRSRPICLAR